MTTDHKKTRPPLYLTIDQGGHSSRAIVFDQHGKALTSCNAGIKTQYPQTDWVEHDPEALIDSIKTVLDQTVDQLGTLANHLHSAGLATQRSSIVCWDIISGKALSPVISWQDRRNAEMIDQLVPHATDIQALTGLRLSPHYGASKLRWCLDYLPAVQQAMQDQRLACGPLSSFILFRILEESPLLVDPANASRTVLWDLQLQTWSSYLLALFGIDENILPHCTPSRSHFGHLKLGHISLPLTVTTGDQSSAIYAYGQPRSDTAFINIGTGAFLQRFTEAQTIKSNTLLCSTVWQDEKTTSYVMEGTVNGAGSAVSKIIKELDLDYQKTIDKTENWLTEYKQPPLFLNGVGGLGSPFWIADFPSRFIGSGSDAEKIVAVMESIVFLVSINLQEMKNNLGGIRQIILSGGLSRLDGLCQRIANLNELTVTRPDYDEATSCGLAFLLHQDCSQDQGLSNQSSSWNRCAIKKFSPSADPALTFRFKEWSVQMKIVNKP